ncbi:hypothetical protein ABTF68_22285, partial [Acinetobacter baumannii]
LRLPLVLADEQPAPLGRLDGLAVLLVSPSTVEPAVLARRLKARGAEVLHVDAVAAIPPDGRFDTALIDRRLGDEDVGAALS